MSCTCGSATDPAAWIPSLTISVVSLAVSVLVALASYQYLRSSRQDLALYFQDKSFESQAKIAVSDAQLWASKMNSWDSWDAAIKGKVEAVSNQPEVHFVFDPEYAYNYALYFLTLHAAQEDYKVLKKLNRTLQSFWQSTFTLKKEFAIPEDIFKNGHWLERAKAYRYVMEPIDISNYYSSGFDSGSGYLEGNNRPADYQKIEELEGDNNGFTVGDRQELIKKLKDLRDALNRA